MAKGRRKLTKTESYARAIRMVIDDGEAISAAARKYKLNRSHLSKRVRETREKSEVRVKAQEEVGPRPTPSGTEFMSFEDFFQTYFTNWPCPDCSEEAGHPVHHDFPEFHREMIDALESGSKRVLINLPPYHAKTSLVSVWHSVYQICRNPNIRIAIVSKSIGFARDVVGQIKQALEDESLYDDSERNLIHDFGPFAPESRERPWSRTQLVVKNRTSGEKDPTVLALGVGGQIYGRRFDCIKFDDIATLDNSRNPDTVAKLLEWINKEALSRIGKAGRAVWSGTRVNAGDIYSHLMGVNGYTVIKKSVLVDEVSESVLWPEHFPFSQVQTHRNEMTPAEFQLIYQNVDIPGLGASFTQEMIDDAKDMERVVGMFDPGWRVIAGLDPAGPSKDSGYTAFSLLGLDQRTGVRYIIDSYAERSMKAPDAKDLILEWTSKYPISEWRIESNALQAQIYQYDTELVQALANQGVRLYPHYTGKNKYDPQFGVESMAPLLTAGLLNIPWGNTPSNQRIQPLLEEMVAYPMGVLSDRLMALWFAELGAKEIMRQANIPLFHARESRRLPARIANKRKVINLETRTVSPVPVEDADWVGAHGAMRMVNGRLWTPGNEPVEELEPENPYIKKDDRVANIPVEAIWN